MKILFVENHKIFANLITRRLLAQHDVAIVPSLKESRRVLQNDYFDLVLIDYDLDDGKGSELIEELKTREIVPVIIGISSHEKGNEILLNRGADTICSKKELPDNINKIIDNLCRD